MASPPTTRAPLAHDASSSSDNLPEDVLSAVLRLLPAKELCCLRTICRSWRSLISDPDFIRAHADRHREPLFLAKFRDDDTHVHVLDLSGNMVKRIAGADGGHQILRTRLNMACLATEWNTCRLLNPATGGIRVLPLIPAVHYVNGMFLRNACAFFTLGLVASTGEYKLLRCWRPFSQLGFVHRQQLTGVHVLTVNGGTDWSWRPRPAPGCLIDTGSGAAVDGVVYFLTLPVFHDGAEVPADYILSFDLDREEWRRDLHGPSSTGNVISGQMLRSHLTLADLKGSLVLAHHPPRLSIMDIWFLLDFKSGLWVKEYSIRIESITSSLADGRHLIPLLALPDGRLVVYVAPIGLVFICDPGTNSFTWVDMRDLVDSVAVYTGSLLSLQ